MPGSKKPRKKYRPKPVFADPLGFVLESSKPLAEHDNYVINWKVNNHLSMQALVKGEASKADMDALIAAHNITRALLITKGMPLVDLLAAGKDAIVDIGRRHQELQRFVPRGPQITAINELLSLHDELLDAITVKEFENALAYARREIQAKLTTPIKTSK